MANMTSDTMSKANGAATDFKDKAQDLASSWAQSTKHAGERIGAMASSVSHQASNYLNDGRDYVKSNPAQSIAIAAASGLAIGSLLTMILRSPRK